jgi:hypothetical protein
VSHHPQPSVTEGQRFQSIYLRLLAGVELGRVGDQLRGLDAPAGTDGWSDPGMEHATAERALWKVIRAGRILATAGALDHETRGMAAEPVVTAVGQVPAGIPPWPITLSNSSGQTKLFVTVLAG